MTAIIKIEGIGETYAVKLREAGIRSIEALLELGATPKGREKISTQTGISTGLILEWVNRADLFRIQGIGEEYSDLLEAAGVDTVVELAQRNPDSLYQKLSDANNDKKKVRRLPTLALVKDWVDQAKKLPRVVTH